MIKFFPLPARILFWLLALSFMAACWGDEPEPPTPPAPVTPVDPNPPTPAKDTNAPTITVSKSSVNIIAGPVVSISGSELKIGEESVATWKDDVSTSMKTELNFTTNEGSPKTINSGDKLSDEGKLHIKVTDEAGNSSTAEITLTRNDSQAPAIEVLVQEKNVVAGVKVKIEGNQVLFDNEVAATWTDDFTEICSALLSLDGQAVNSGDILLEAGKLVITVSDNFKNETKAEITLLAEAVYGLENLQGKNLQIDQKVNILEGITFAEGLTLVKVEVEENGVRTEIANPNAYIPQASGHVNIIFTLARTDGSTIEVKVDGISVMGITYNALEIIDVFGKDYLPQVEIGDKEVYDHIDHIRVGEAKRVVEMMWQYGAGSHNKEQYQSLMMRLNTGMLGENPTGYDNYEIVGWGLDDAPSGHAHIEWYILTSLIDHAHFKIIGNSNKWRLLYELCRSNSLQINIFGLSMWSFVDREGYELWYGVWPDTIYKEYDKEKNYLVFLAAGNVGVWDWWFVNKICQEDYDLFDGHTSYGEQSRTHSRNDVVLDRHLMITVSTDNDGDIDQTNERGESAVFPIGFHDKVLFSGRILPYKKNLDDKVRAPDGKYNTSFPNYVNVALADLCFQLYAEVADVDELLEMIRSTAFTDHIRFDLNGDGDTNDIVDGQRETQPLQLINPGGLYKKYLIPKSIPSSLSLGETLELEKGYYKGVVFNIPGAEVKIGDEWIPFTAENASRIKAANPMNLEWRLNGSLLRKYGYTPGQTLQGQIITVDDQWNGLRLEVPMSITIK